jgi:ABC-type transport system involved in multi-copper enzyme maturation permease subunit
MIREFFKFELREQLRSPLLWLLSALFGLLAFGAVASDAVQIGGAIGNVYRNAPTVTVQFMGIFTIFGMLIIGMLVSSALLRDFELGTADLIFSNPIRKRDFLIGRFGAAILASLIVYVVIACFIFIAQFMPWIDPERLGPASLQPLAWAFFIIVLPNVLFTGAVLAFMAVTTRSVLWVYIGILGFMVLYFVSGSMLSKLDNVWMASLLDPFGMRAFGRTVRYWSSAERNSGLPAIGGYILANRALWVAVAFLITAAAFKLFKTERAGTGKAWFSGKNKVSAVVDTPKATSPTAAQPSKVTPTFGSSTSVAQFIRQVRFDAMGVFKSIPFLVMLAFGMVNFIPAALNTQSLFETPIYPVTSQMLETLNGTYSWLLIIIALFYAGELVWKERSAKLGEVTDAMPVANWVPLAAKFAALIFVVICFQALGGITSVLIQLGKGFTQIEPMVYVKILALNSIAYLLMGGLALVLQVFTNNKFIGYGLLIAILVAQGVLGMMDFSHNLYTYGSAPNAQYSDMNGYGHFLTAQLWFTVYWSLFLAALLILASAFWVRGVALTGRDRVALARQKLRGKSGLALAAVTTAFLGAGSFIFYNTNVLNDYLTPNQQLDLQARYEKDFKKYKNTPQPRIIATSLDVDLRPEDQSVHFNGTYRIRNNHPHALKEIHIQMQDDKALTSIDFGKAKMSLHDKDVGYRIYTLEKPMLPGEERDMKFKVDVAEKGFTNSGNQSEIVENGSFFNNRMLPSFGYEERAEITDPNERRKRKMGDPQRMPKLEDEAARANTYIGNDSDWIDFKTTICTAPDQTALAPGYLQKEFTRNGRHCFSYAMDRPMLNFYAYLSAKWKVKKGSYKNIPIEIYYDPKHAFNVDRMIYSVQKSLAYYEANFSPYQHKQVRIIEFPGYARFAQSFANTIPYSEDIGFVADLRDPDNIDYVFYVTAHEIAHQWWAHQVIGANVQGATVLSESLAQYSALMVMEKEYGPQKMRRFLKYELDRYLSDRGGELVEEQPLYRVENQQYIHYRKGSMVFYRLREEMGEAALNRALSKFIADKAYQKAPFTTSKELITYIRAEAKPEQQVLITDLFEKISFYDNRVEEASAKKRSDGKYDVTLSLHADKLYSDGKGKETPGTLDDWIEVGIYSGEDDKNQKVLYLKRHHITEKNLKISIVVDQLPTQAGFDPNNKLIDRVSVDNRKKVSLGN